MMLRALLLLIILSAAPAYATDQDSDLYAPAPPPGSSFVRFFNSTDQENIVTIGGKEYGALGPYSASPYYVQPGDDIGLKIGDKGAFHALDAGGFYTVALDNDGEILIHPDAVQDDPAKALVVLYNLGDKGPLFLKAKDGMVSVLDGVEYGKSGWRGINPVKVDFSVLDSGGNKLAMPEPVILERGRVYSIFYAGGKAIVVKGETDTTR